MRNGNLFFNILIYYFILNLISSPFVIGYLHFYEKYRLFENDLIKTLTLGVFIGWYILLHIITYLSARQSTNNGDGIEDAILGAFNELIMYTKLAFPFFRKLGDVVTYVAKHLTQPPEVDNIATCHAALA